MHDAGFRDRTSLPIPFLPHRRSVAASPIMFNVFVISPYGNANGRFFPHAGEGPARRLLRVNADGSGHLGLSSVHVSGTIITKLPALGSPLSVKSVHVAVKCYEIRSTTPLLSGQENVLWEKTRRIWEPPAENDYEEIGNWEVPFRLTIPPEVAKKVQSTQWLKDWRAQWRLEVVIDHKPIPYVGYRIYKAFQLGLHKYTVPVSPPLSPPSPITIGIEDTAMQVHVNAPHGAFGPGDTVTVSFHAKADDPAVIPRRAHLVLERYMSFADSRGRDESPDSGPSMRLSSLLRRSVSPRPHHSSKPSDTMSDPARIDDSHCTTQRIAEATCDDLSLVGDSYSGSLSLTLPKRGGKWDVGESLQTSQVNIAFRIRLKLHVKPSKSRSQLREITCPAIPLIVVGTSAQDRAEAAAASPKLSPSTTKRRHRSSRRGLYMHEGTIDISDPIVAGRRRTRSRSQPSSPNLMTSLPTAVKPILLAPGHTPQPTSISFTFPSAATASSPIARASSTSPEEKPRQDDSPPPNVTLLAPKLETLLNPTFPTHLDGRRASLPPFSFAISGESSGSAFHAPPSPPPTADLYDSLSILRRFHSTGRRVSTTTSEEEELQPSRSRQRVSIAQSDGTAEFEPEADRRPGLPSLDALGLGLPHVPDDRPVRRPRTAPLYSTFTRNVPPPLSGNLSTVLEDRSKEQLAVRPVTSMGRLPSQDRLAPEQNFAFGPEQS